MLLLLFSPKFCPTFCDPMDCSTPDFHVLHYLPYCSFIFIELVMPSNHVICCHPSSFCFQSFPASESFPMSQLFTSDYQSTAIINRIIAIRNFSLNYLYK